MMLDLPMPFQLPDSFDCGMDVTRASKEMWFIFSDSKLLIYEGTCLPYQDRTLSLHRSVYIGSWNENAVYAGELSPEASVPEGVAEVGMRQLFDVMDVTTLSVAGRALQLLTWDHTSQFCGQCGSKLMAREEERAKECPACKSLVFPRIAPAVIVLIQRGESILLARNRLSTTGFWSTLAGFVDPGETLEQCVHREVFEEVGLKVDSLQYFGSQPWPFPHTLMIGFTCRWHSGEIKIDPSEIADAQWFTKDSLPPLPPRVSIARVLVDSAFSR